MNKLQAVLTVIGISCVVTTANAASMFFVHTGSNAIDDEGRVLASAGDLVTFDIVMDFSDDPMLQGGYDLFFTADTLRFEAFELVVVGDPSFNQAPGVSGFDGFLEGGAFGSFDGVAGPATVGRISFTFLGGPVATMQLGVSTDIPFISIDLLNKIPVEFGGAAIITPLPGAAWFLLSAMGSLGALRRCRTRAVTR